MEKYPLNPSTKQKVLTHTEKYHPIAAVSFFSQIVLEWESIRPHSQNNKKEY